MKRKVYTTDELFLIIMKQLTDEEKVPGIIDYALPEGNAVPLMNYAFDVLGCVNYGYSEGIYVDLFYNGDIGASQVTKGQIGTIKTLRRDAESFRQMALLMSNFQINAHQFINSHLDDFTHTGYDAHFYFDGDSEDNFRYGYTDHRSKSLNEAKKDACRYLCMEPPYDYDYAIVLENSTGKEVFIRHTDVKDA